MPCPEGPYHRTGFPVSPRPESGAPKLRFTTVTDRSTRPFDGFVGPESNEVYISRTFSQTVRVPSTNYLRPTKIVMVEVVDTQSNTGLNFLINSVRKSRRFIINNCIV